ncbi:MAG: hypothetical protein WCO00_06945 [Rhodospirillaceae bacterium]
MTHEDVASPKNIALTPTSFADELPAPLPGDSIAAVGALALGACCHSVPWMALAFNFFAKVPEFVNNRMMIEFLRKVAMTVDSLTETVVGIRDELAKSAHYTNMIQHGMLQVASGEEDQEFLDAVRNAAFNLHLSNKGDLTKKQVMILIRKMTAIQLRVLLVYNSYWNKSLSSADQAIIELAGPDNDENHGKRLGALVRHVVPYQFVAVTVRELRALEVIQGGVSGSHFEADDDELEAVEVTDLGKLVLEIFAPLRN